MLVIGGRKLRFRVNVKRTISVIAPKNYGSFHDLSAIPAATAGPGYRPPNAFLEFCRMKFRAIEGRACDMANRIFPRLPCRRRFDSMMARGNKQAPPFARALKGRGKIPCRSSRPTVLHASA